MSAPTAMPNQWRPISSAPKDGTEVDLWCTHPHLGGLRSADMLWRGAEWVKGDVPFHEPLNPGWEPTHWQPLPPPPIEGESSYLNKPTLSARDRAFEVARQALCTIARHRLDQPGRYVVDKALADIAALIGDAAALTREV